MQKLLSYAIIIGLFLPISSVFAQIDIERHNETGSRSLSVEYINPFENAMFLSVRASGLAGNALSIVVNAETTSSCVFLDSSSGFAIATCVSMIPVGGSYTVNCTGCTINTWTESEFVLGAISMATTTNFVINSNQDVYNGIFLFGATFFFIIWFFRRPRV